MNRNSINSSLKHLALGATLILGAALAQAGTVKVQLSGAEQTPAVTTAASGWGEISVGADKSVTGSVTTKDVQGTAAHIHQAAAGKSGPPVISLSKGADNVWSVPADSKLSDEQYASYLAGNLYVNVHSAAYKPGEIRGQLRP
jgi:hypothetical protein